MRYLIEDFGELAVVIVIGLVPVAALAGALSWLVLSLTDGPEWSFVTLWWQIYLFWMIVFVAVTAATIIKRVFWTEKYKRRFQVSFEETAEAVGRHQLLREPERNSWSSEQFCQWLEKQRKEWKKGEFWLDMPFWP